MRGFCPPTLIASPAIRLCGERVVRVDIIERLSDLIRAAIPDHMRFGSRPSSETYGFVITPPMTSLTGCSGEAFASILRSLGFEAVKVSKAAFEAANRKAPTEPIKPATREEAAEAAETPAKAEAAESASTEAASETEEPRRRVARGRARRRGGAGVRGDGPRGARCGDAERRRLVVAAGARPRRRLCASKVAPRRRCRDGGARTIPTQRPICPRQAKSLRRSPDRVWPPKRLRRRYRRRLRPRWRRTRRSRSGARRRGARARRNARTVAEQRGGPLAPRQVPRVAAQAAGPPRLAPLRSAASAEAPPRPQGRIHRPERRDEGPRRHETKGNEERVREDRRPPKDFGPRRESRPVTVDPDSPFAKLAALKPLA